MLRFELVIVIELLIRFVMIEGDDKNEVKTLTAFSVETLIEGDDKNEVKMLSAVSVETLRLNSGARTGNHCP